MRLLAAPLQDRHRKTCEPISTNPNTAYAEKMIKRGKRAYKRVFDDIRTRNVDYGDSDATSPDHSLTSQQEHQIESKESPATE